MPLKGAANKRGAGVGGERTAPEEPKPAQKFYSQAEKDGDVLDILLTDITPNPFNDIRTMGDLNALAQSIEEDGLLQSIVVMHTEEFVARWPQFADGPKAIKTKYVIAFGERRWRGTEIAGKPFISAVLNNAVIPKIRRVLLVENLQRQPYSPMEEARNFWRLHTEEGMSYREIAKEVKIGSTHVSRRLQLIALPESVQAAVEEGSLNVTDARRLEEALKDSPEEQEAAWRYAVQNEVPIKDAIQAINAGDVVVDEGQKDEGAPEGEGTPEGEQSDIPEQRTDSEQDSDGPDEPEQQNLPEAKPEQSLAPQEKPKPERNEPPAPKARASTAADRSARERNSAAADRTQACLHLVTSGFVPDEKQLNALYARTLLSPIQQGPAKTRAHAWLREAGKDVIGVSDSDSYFQAVLSSGNDDLVQLATFVTALAASEIRAKDNRRQWDRTDAAHVEFLIQAAGYVVATQWERDQLTKFGVTFDASTPTDEPVL
ncbi:ParB/RepB/Spo0J family partition protein [Streptomyces coeruleorubidus]|uniref:ParB/RepB/Spo0J family partition protein n=1 Tax=Streptomyces coeruleorubidus TaxID=116188 RepID=UPI0033BB9862